MTVGWAHSLLSTLITSKIFATSKIHSNAQRLFTKPGKGNAPNLHWNTQVLQVLGQISLCCCIILVTPASSKQGSYCLTDEQNSSSTWKHHLERFLSNCQISAQNSMTEQLHLPAAAYHKASGNMQALGKRGKGVVRLIKPLQRGGLLTLFTACFYVDL